MTSPIVIAIHGILTRQFRVSWPDRFDAWCASNAPSVRVLKKEYRAAPLPIWNTQLKNRWLARAIAAEVALFPAVADRKVNFVSHSNGTDIALKTIRLLAARGVVTDTFIAVGSILPTCLKASGVADLISDGALRRAVAYVSNTDRAVGVTRWPVLRRFTPYQDLGRRGWRLNGVALAHTWRDGEQLFHPIGDGEVMTRRFDGYDHGTYFDPNIREQTFALFRKDLGL